MSRSHRLLRLIEVLRRHRRPVSGAKLAFELEVSLRSIYRDVATLRAQGADIEGEAGVGYILRPGFLLPPLMFSEEEIEAVVLGASWVSSRADAPLGSAARNALAKIAAVLPPDLRIDFEATSLLIGPSTAPKDHSPHLPSLRRAVRAERKIVIRYRDEKGQDSERTLWPIALVFFDDCRIVVAWCELRKEFRHFRSDRIISIQETETRYPKRRRSLVREWRAAQGISSEDL
ncbi:helix-turn-helix transcriptional regulator [Methylocystis bryophila]|uniref:Transcriptional regulator n=1 Tax=Methylocystis bryophila TaxID=655015 RepID=A0A1W6MUU5_9HYPH|nr:YafY family protein [Methylocystis bryophila]ARN81345.1 transcriptional regulator [Methylocystis bryophila]BDV37328.1 DeoR family transcriptional regulator [Methylocystis bryophila]